MAPLIDPHDTKCAPSREAGTMPAGTQHVACASHLASPFSALPLSTTSDPLAQVHHLPCARDTRTDSTYIYSFFSLCRSAMLQGIAPQEDIDLLPFVAQCVFGDLMHPPSLCLHDSPWVHA